MGGVIVERIKNLNRYQKVILLLLLAMLVVFTAAYFIVSSRVGFAYKGAILRPQDEGTSTVYSGRISGESASFTVTQNKTVTFRYGDKTYGPYTAREDPAAVPQDSEMAKHMTGVEIREGDAIFFRGGVLETGGSSRELMLFDEDGGFASIDVMVSSGNGIMYDGEGNVIDQMAPSATTILRLMDDPELTSKGDWLAWFCGVFFSALTVILILFADELFRWNLRFMIRNVDRAEPSDWEIAERYISWTILPIAALVIYIMGLRI